MKYKKLTKEQIIISLDRLTRFKNTKEKYLRVYKDILLHSLIEPKMRNSDIEKLDSKELTGIVTEIFNNSVSALLSSTDMDKIIDNKVSKIISDYENSVYINDSETQKLLNNDFCYSIIADLITEDSSVNLKWLKYIIKNPDSDIKELRNKHFLKFPIEKIILAEGITEEILLPAFSKFLGFDFYQNGIQIIAAGGKNQVVRLYYKMTEELKIPIFILLDKDAEENINQITPKLRDIDKIHLVSCGEFEDLLPKSLIVKTVNNHFENFLSINEHNLESDVPNAKILTELFKTKGLHEFKKAEFAKLVRENISSDTDISDEIRNIADELRR